MRVPNQATLGPDGRLLAVGLIAVAMALGACTSSAAGPLASLAASASTLAAPSASGSTLSSASAPTASAIPSASAGVSPVASIVPSLGDLKLLWQKAGPTLVKTETYWPAIDPLTGDIWVASSFQDAYWIFKPDGTYVDTWGTAGSGPGQLALTTHDPHPDGVGAIAFAPDGSFYIADNGNYRVEEFDKDRHFARQWGGFGTGNGQFVSPKGIATDGKLVYVADDPRGDMQVFDTDGKFLRSFPFPNIFFTLTRDGHLLFADNEASELIVMDATGKVLDRYPIDFAGYGPDASVAGSPTGAGQPVQEPNGRILIVIGNLTAGKGGLLEIDQQGQVVRRWSTGSETMALAPDGTSLYMALTGPSLTGWPYFRKYALPRG